MPQSLNDIHPILKVWLEARRQRQARDEYLGRERIERERTEAQVKAEEARNKRETERDKQAHEVAKATLALNQALRAENRSRGLREDLLKGFPVTGIPRPESAPINQPGSDLYTQILNQDPSSWGGAFRPREMSIETAPGISAGDISIPAIRESFPTPEAVQQGVYGMQAPLIQLKEKSAMDRLLGLERIRAANQRDLETIRQSGRLDIQTQKDEAAMERAKVMAAARRAAGLKEDKKVTLAEAATYGVPVGTSYRDLEGVTPSKPLTSIEEDKLNTYTAIAERLTNIKNLSDQVGWDKVFKPLVGNIVSSYENVRGTETPEVAGIRRNVAEIKAAIAKARAGTSFTPNEQALLENYVMNLTDNPIRAQVKLQSGLKDAIKNIEGLTRPATRRTVGPKKLTPAEALQRGLVWDDSVKAYRKVRN